jgi:hypothetical protein
MLLTFGGAASQVALVRHRLHASHAFAASKPGS